MESLQGVIEQLQQNIVQLTGGLNAQIEQSRILEAKLARFDRQNQAAESDILATPRTENDLREISRLPDSVKELQVFEGNQMQYISWVHNVESILRDYEIVSHKPIYGAILKHIRQKIRGDADNALISYNIFNSSWSEIKKCLSLHYADKRDIQSLENQLMTLYQGRETIDTFYSRVNHQLSLIINKIKTEDYSNEGMTILTENYRQRALDVFIRGLPQNIAQLIKVQRPMTLPEAYSACMELQNMNFRKNMNFPQPTQVSGPYLPPMVPQNRVNKVFHNQFVKPTIEPHFARARHPIPVPRDFPPPRSIHPKPPVPMDIDPSIHSAKVNYINRQAPKMSAGPNPSHESSNIPRKTQRIFSVNTVKDKNSQDYIEEIEENENLPQEENFHSKASQQHLT